MAVNRYVTACSVWSSPKSTSDGSAALVKVMAGLTTTTSASSAAVTGGLLPAKGALPCAGFSGVAVTPATLCTSWVGWEVQL